MKCVCASQADLYSYEGNIIASNSDQLIRKLERICKEAVGIDCKVLSRHVARGGGKSRKACQENQSVGRGLPLSIKSGLKYKVKLSLVMEVLAQLRYS
jgi:hypothetical protein